MTASEMIISVVTVVYNSVNNIEKTIVSVLKQTAFSKIEYIVIDGGSDDGTVDIIKKYTNQIYYWHSLPDKGIYDAMNIGIIHTNGQYAFYLNAGDTFYNEKVIENLTKSFIKKADIIYGDTLIEYKHYNKLSRSGKADKLKNAMPFSHQAVFVKTHLIKKFKFNLKYTICADVDLFMNLYLNNCSYLKVNMIISKYDTLGYSTVNFIKLRKERNSILFCYKAISKWDYLMNKYLNIPRKQIIHRLTPDFIRNVKNYLLRIRYLNTEIEES